MVELFSPLPVYELLPSAVCLKEIMSLTGQSRHFDRGPAPSGLPRSTDIVRPPRHVELVPDSDLGRFTSNIDFGYYVVTCVDAVFHVTTWILLRPEGWQLRDHRRAFDPR
jgi:hypothetical protein